ncbi:MAG: hypothetical protein EOO00_00415 [Chitinophagaceae bacterium]|nr:MAG: hypothetical protein EOO00_00415 [Chitinophagaceae bacterium]
MASEQEIILKLLQLATIAATTAKVRNSRGQYALGLAFTPYELMLPVAIFSDTPGFASITTSHPFKRDPRVTI